ncbi:hypothetical protein JQ604_12065 [Bradyrhizobium jicamae]|uniref:hypothetical protein n=1 Tax=Bradyrhizobium jicamae TaxID=280332 RepID=UPI001BAE53ED|nr:hypothetical protein [Bradyrhizobium jicamae]MBR0752921.1 hypothetical protein [Bradyrhizobium jicamae]
MALSDVCFDFVAEIRSARSDLKRRKAVLNLRQVSSEYRGSPLGYGSEIDALVTACDDFLDGTTAAASAAALERLLFMADSIREFYDRPPGVTGLSSKML